MAVNEDNEMGKRVTMALCETLGVNPAGVTSMTFEIGTSDHVTIQYQCVRRIDRMSFYEAIAGAKAQVESEL